jgi:L-threonylcarbamoyladenylate synthase
MEERYDKDDMSQALEVLKSGGVILYPTDTVWGLGCDATNEEAVKKLMELKKRSVSKGFVVLTDNAGRISQFVKQMPELAWDLIEMSTKPLSIIYSAGKDVANDVLGVNGSICVRVTTEFFSNSLIARYRKPIVVTSANISGLATPKNFKEIDKGLISKVDYVVKYRQTESKVHKSSGIIKLGVNGQIEIIRE